MLPAHEAIHELTKRVMLYALHVHHVEELNTIYLDSGGKINAAYQMSKDAGINAFEAFLLIHLPDCQAFEPPPRQEVEQRVADFMRTAA